MGELQCVLLPRVQIEMLTGGCYLHTQSFERWLICDLSAWNSEPDDTALVFMAAAMHRLQFRAIHIPFKVSKAKRGAHLL